MRKIVMTASHDNFSWYTTFLSKHPRLYGTLIMYNILSNANFMLLHTTGEGYFCLRKSKVCFSVHKSNDSLNKDEEEHY